jgi:membrane fusion protein (multidrug efflux system)
MPFMHVSVWSQARPYLICSLLLASMCTGLFIGCGRGAHANTAEKPKAPELPVISAAVLEIQPAVWPAVVRTQGSLAPDEVAIVGAKVAGRVNEVNFDLGDAVRGGIILASLDQDDFKLQVLLSESQLMQSRAALGLRPGDPLESLDPNFAPPVREAKAVWDETRARIARVRQLQQHARNTVTQEEYDQAVASEGAAEARHAAAINAVREKIALISVRASELEVAKQHLTDTVIHAPFDGLIQERHVGHGSFVQLGDPIATLVRTSVVRFHGTMPERHAHRLQLGQQVKLKIEGIDQPRIAKITRISPNVEELSRSLAFEALLDNQDFRLRTGLFAEAEVVVDPVAQSLIVPPAPIMEFAGAEKVWKLINGVAKETIVRTARHGDRGVEIISGLAPGDLILANATEGRVAKIDAIIAPSPNGMPPNGAIEPAEATAAEELGSQELITPTSARLR